MHLKWRLRQRPTQAPSENKQNGGREESHSIASPIGISIRASYRYIVLVLQKKKRRRKWLPPLFLSFPPPWTALPLRELASTRKQSKQQGSSGMGNHRWRGKAKKGKGKAAEASNDQAIGPNTRRTMEATKRIFTASDRKRRRHIAKQNEKSQAAGLIPSLRLKENLSTKKKKEIAHKAEAALLN